jgi:hypothetical protein
LTVILRLKQCKPNRQGGFFRIGRELDEGGNRSLYENRNAKMAKAASAGFESGWQMVKKTRLSAALLMRAASASLIAMVWNY